MAEFSGVFDGNPGNDPEAMAWYEERYLGNDPDFDALVALPDNTLGAQYARHIVDNGLNNPSPATTAAPTTNSTPKDGCTACPTKPNAQCYAASKSTTSSTSSPDTRPPAGARWPSKHSHSPNAHSRTHRCGWRPSPRK